MSAVQRTTEVYESPAEVNGSRVERSVVQTGPQSGVIILQRAVWLVAGVIDALLAIRFILLLLGANQTAGFVDFIYAITTPLVAPFVGIFGEPVYGRFMFDWSSILAIIVYSLIAWALVRLLSLATPRETL